MKIKIGDLVREKVDANGVTLRGPYVRETGIVVEIMHFPANDYAPIQFRLIPLGESKPTLHQRNARFYEVIG